MFSASSRTNTITGKEKTFQLSSVNSHNKDDSEVFCLVKDEEMPKTLTHSQTTNFRLFQTRFDKNGRQFSKRVENTVEKGEIACYEQFFYFP